MKELSGSFRKIGAPYNCSKTKQCCTVDCFPRKKMTESPFCQRDATHFICPVLRHQELNSIVFLMIKRWTFFCQALQFFTVFCKKYFWPSAKKWSDGHWLHQQCTVEWFISPLSSVFQAKHSQILALNWSFSFFKLKHWNFRRKTAKF